MKKMGSKCSQVNETGPEVFVKMAGLLFLADFLASFHRVPESQVFSIPLSARQAHGSSAHMQNLLTPGLPRDMLSNLTFLSCFHPHLRDSESTWGPRQGHRQYENPISPPWFWKHHAA